MKWQNLKDNAIKNDRICKLSLDEYKQLAREAGIDDPNLIGKSIDSFQLGSFGDVGDYELGNCRFITMKQNLIERQENGGNRSISIKMSGRTKETHIGTLKGAVAKSGRTKETFEGILAQSLKVSKYYILFDPDGNRYEGYNLTEFCKDNGLNQGNMASVCRGVKKYHKGWTGNYDMDKEVT